MAVDTTHQTIGHAGVYGKPTFRLLSVEPHEILNDVEVSAGPFAFYRIGTPRPLDVFSIPCDSGRKRTYDRYKNQTEPIIRNNPELPT